MFKKLFKSQKKDTTKVIEYDELQYSCAILLIESALMDETFGNDEKEVIINLLSKQFKLDNKKALDLMQKALIEVKDNVDLVSFTRSIKKSWSLEKRSEFLEMMWKVVLIDNKVDPYEDMLIRRVAGLIYVSNKDRNKAKKKAQEEILKERQK